MKNAFKNIVFQARIPALWMIKIYQKTLSLDHGPLAKVFPFFGCKFHPSCSNYTYQAIAKYGVFKGVYMGAKRILRCNPFSHGGNDPVPEEKKKLI